MWVTQTYLGNVEQDAKLFVYYFFEDYNNEQKEFTNQIEQELGKLGEAYGDKVSLLMPNPSYAGRIEAEMRGYNDWIWSSLAGDLPGLFISPKPIKALEESDEGCMYIPFVGKDSKAVAEVIRKVRQIANNNLHWEFSNPYAKNSDSLVSRFIDALEIKPSIGPFKFDVRKFFRIQTSVFK